MYCRPWPQITSDLPLGGVGCVSEDSRNGALEFGGLRMLPSLTKVTTVRITRTAAAPTVQPTSSAVLPWIWAATFTFLARKRKTENVSAPSTRQDTTASMSRMIMYSEWIWLAFGEPPALGVMKFANALGASTS